MRPGHARVAAATALAMSAALAVFAFVSRDGPQAAEADPCAAVRTLANTRAREADQAYQAFVSTPDPGWRRDFRNPPQTPGTPSRAVTYAVARYAAVVEQNATCFDATTRADADALARVWYAK